MKFETGKEYKWCDSGLDCIKVIRRTEKYIYVDNGRTTWKMLIRKDPLGNEYVIDSSVPKRLRNIYTCYSEWEVKED